MKHFIKEFLISIMFISIMCISISIIPRSAVTDTFADETPLKNGLYHEDSSWNYYLDGKIDNTKTLVKYNGSWWFVHDGKIDFKNNTLVKYNGSWWHVHNGRVDFNSNTLVKYNGSWWFVENGRVNFNKTTLIKYNGYWFYVHDGMVDFSAHTLCKYNGTWWFINNGIVDFKAQTVIKYGSTWYYVNNGRVSWNSTGLCKYNDSWWYIRNGRIDFNAATLCKYNGSWWFVDSGRVDFSANTIYKYNGIWWHIENGRVNFHKNSNFFISEIPDVIFNKMYGKSYKADCTVSRSDLRYVHILHVGFDGQTHEGELVVNKQIADDVLDIFTELYKAGYQIEKVRLIDEYDADDNASMSDNNTSSFNFRFVPHTTKISKHGKGMAIDINTLYNPYTPRVNGKISVEPANATPYVDREQDFPHKIDHNDLCYKLFTEHGFTWGGDWINSKDYQHFEK